MTLLEEANRRGLLKILENPEPVLKQSEYPEFREGSEAWVRHLREEDERLDREKLGDWIGSENRDEVAL